MRFQELVEAPQALLGDLDWDDVQLRYTETGLSMNWKIVGQLLTALGDLDIARGQHSWIVGKMLSHR